MRAIYDRIGDGYDTTRRADPGIVSGFREQLSIVKNGHYLDIACGTGNYTSALALCGGHWSAFDNSEKMLIEARKKSDAVKWYHFPVENTGFADGFFDGAVCSLAIHHFPDRGLAFQEIARILKPQSRVVIFTADPNQMQSYWLNHYFPVMMEKSILQMPTLEAVGAAMGDNGIGMISTIPYLIEPDHQDLFLYSGKQRPAMYLSASVRAGISSFRNFCSDAELEKGLINLKGDIESGVIAEVMAQHESGAGDYLFIVGSKTA